MKKIFENFYLFSKLTTSLFLFVSLILMGYFFYTSYKDQNSILTEKKIKENIIKKDIENNTNEILKISNNLDNNKELLLKIDKLLKDNISKKNVLSFNKEINISLEQIQNNINNLTKEIKSIKVRVDQFDGLNNAANKYSNFIDDKSIKDLVNLILIKYENSVDFYFELNSLEKIIPSNKIYLIDKIRVIVTKPYKGHSFLQNQFKEEMQNYIKNKVEKKNINFLFKIIMPYIKIEPSQQNSINSNDSLLLLRINKLIDERQMQKALESIQYLDDYENFFSNTINQTNIYIEFNQNILELI